MRLLIIGPPGAGKGTQASCLSQTLGVPHVSSGALLREAIADGTPEGLRARRCVERGRLVPDDVVVEVLRERFEARDLAARGYLLDGFPRNVDQVARLRELDPDGRVDAVVQLIATAAVIRERLRDRDRADDRTAALSTRLVEYERSRRPLLDLLARVAPIVIVDAAQPVSDVTDQILFGLERVGVITCDFALADARRRLGS